MITGYMRERDEVTEGSGKLDDGAVRDFWSPPSVTEIHQTTDSETGAARDTRGGK